MHQGWLVEADISEERRRKGKTRSKAQLKEKDIPEEPKKYYCACRMVCTLVERNLANSPFCDKDT